MMMSICIRFYLNYPQTKMCTNVHLLYILGTCRKRTRLWLLGSWLESVAIFPARCCPTIGEMAWKPSCKTV